jgi:hypothetical protein
LSLLFIFQMDEPITGVGFPLQSVGEEIPMTMQVGMVGLDGILIASDTLWSNTEGNQFAATRHTNNTTKITIDHAKGVAIACARSMELADQIAEDLLRKLSSEDWAGPENIAVQIANDAIAKLPERRRIFQCLIATIKPEWQLFHLHAGLFEGRVGARCQRQDHTVFAGDTVNSAVFWRERYYSSYSEPPLRPIDELIPLAAHIVLSAGEISRGYIGGLEIVRCDKDGVRLLSPESIDRLRHKSKEWDRRFGEEILSHDQQFTYVAVAKSPPISPET